MNYKSSLTVSALQQVKEALTRRVARAGATLIHRMFQIVSRQKQARDYQQFHARMGAKHCAAMAMIKRSKDYGELCLCHGPFASRAFRRRFPWLDEELWHEGIEGYGRAEGVRN